MIRGLMIACLMLLLTACKPALVQTKTEYRYPPAYLMEPCPFAPKPPIGATNADLSKYILDTETMLDICNSDKREMRNLATERSEE